MKILSSGKNPKSSDAVRKISGPWVYFLAAVVVFFLPSILPSFAKIPSLALTISFACVYVLPGYVLARLIFPNDRWWPELLTLSFGLSFVMSLIFIVVMVEFHLGLQTAIWGWVGLLALGLILLPFISRSTGVTGIDSGEDHNWILAVSGLLMLGFILVAAYHIGGTYGSLAGEEGYHIIFTRKIYSNISLNPYNLFYLPGSSSTYLYMPYHFSLALMAKLSGLDPMSVYIKFRPFAALMTLVTMSAFAKQLIGSRLAGWTMLNVLCVLVITNHLGYHSPYFAQFLPVSHHSDISLGLGLAMGGYFFWRAVNSERRFGPEFWAGVAVCVAVLICHTREGIQFLIYSGVMLFVALVFRFKNKTLIWHALIFSVLLFLAGKFYQVLQTVRASHLIGWEEAEKAVAWTNLKILVKTLLDGGWLAFFGPRIDQTSSYMPNYDLFFRSVYSLGLVIAPIAFWKSKKLWAVFIPLLIGVILLVTRLPLAAYALVIGGYSQILYTPVRFIMHWEVLLLGISVHYVISKLSEKNIGVFLFVPALLLVVMGWKIIPRLTTRLEAFSLAHPDLIVIYVLLMLQLGLVWKVRKAAATRSASFLISNEKQDQGTVKKWIYSVLVLSLILPMLAWNYPPSLREQWTTSQGKPSGLDVNRWCHEKDLLNLPDSSLRFIREQISTGKVFAYDSRYIFNLPVVFNQYIFTFGFYFSSEREFFDRYYAIRGHVPPFKKYITTMYRYVDVYINDLMLRFPLFNWLDPLDVTLADIRDNHIDYVLVSPEFQPLWRVYQEYFPEVFAREFDEDGFVIYSVQREKLDGALKSIVQDPKRWLKKDLSHGFEVRILESLDRWKTKLSAREFDEIFRSVWNQLPKNLRSIVPRGSSETQLLWLRKRIVFIPAQKHYDTHVDARNFISQNGRHYLPVFFPKSAEYVVDVNGKSFPVKGGRIQQLDFDGKDIQSVRIVEDLKKAAIQVDLPQEKS